MSPRFQGDNLDRNLALVEALRKVADAKGVSVAQIAIAWVAAQGDDIVPLVGARRRDRLERGARRAGGSASMPPILRPSTRPCPRVRRPATATRLTQMAIARQRKSLKI